MGFGEGIGRQSRQSRLTFDATLAEPWNLFSTDLRTLIVVPPGNPEPILEPRTRSDATSRARRLVQRESRSGQGGSVSLRTVTGDARDLFLQTVQRTNAGGTEQASSACVWQDTSNGELRQYSAGSDVVPRSAVEVHIGWTRELGIAATPWTRDDIDGDGFIAFARRLSGRVILGLAGGSEYGDYFAVAWFLREYLSASWLLPGPRGIDVPDYDRAPISISREVAHLQEPWIRGRTLDGLANSALPIEECDQIRDWALRNLVWPGNCRPLMRQKLSPAELGICAEPLDPWGDAAILYETETRFPVEHNQNQLVSPTRPSGPSGSALYRSQPDLFPDIRPRLRSNAGTPGVQDVWTLAEPRAPWVDPRMTIGAVLSSQRLNFNTTLPTDTSNEPCGETGARLDRWEEFRSDQIGFSVRLRMDGAQEPLVSDYSTQNWDVQIAPFVGVILVPGPAAAEFQRPRYSARFIPRSLFRYRGTTHYPPTSAWKPCVYADHVLADEEQRKGALRPIRPELGVLVGQIVILWLLRRFSLTDNSESAISIALNDGLGWCQCDACALSFAKSASVRLSPADSHPSGRGNFVTVHGYPVLNDDSLEAASLHMNEELQRGVQVSEQRVPTLPSLDSMPDAIRRFMGVTQTGMGTISSSQLAYQGMLLHPNSRLGSLYTRAAVDYANAVAYAVDPEPTIEDSVFRDYFITTQAYGYGTCAPYFPALAVDLSVPIDFRGGASVFAPGASVDALRGPRHIEGEWGRLHPKLMPHVVECSDHSEWATSPPMGMTPTHFFARFPRWFNRVRWAMISDHLGHYEYLYGRGFVVPRLYTRRLYRALRVNALWKTRAFYAETYPNWALDALTLHEAATLMWRVPTLLPNEIRPRGAAGGAALAPYPETVTVRIEWCDSMYGPASAQMREVHDRIERQWGDCVDALEGRPTDKSLPFLRSSAEQLNGVDPVRESPDHWIIGDFVGRLESSRSLPSISVLQRSRVELLLQAFKVIESLARSSRPIRIAHAAIAERGGLPMIGRSEFESSPGLSDALRQMNQIVGIELFRNSVRRDLHVAFAAQGLVRLADQVEWPGAGEWARKMTVADDSGSVFSYKRVMFDAPYFDSYIGWWNTALDAMRGMRAAGSLTWEAGLVDIKELGFQSALYGMKELVMQVAIAMINGRIRWDGAMSPATGGNGPFTSIHFFTEMTGSTVQLFGNTPTSDSIQFLANA